MAFDLRVFHPASASANAQLDLEFFTDSGEGLGCSGVEKLRQQVLLVLLKAQGTQRNSPSSGCRFINDSMRGAWRTTEDVARSFVAAVLDVKRQLRAAEPVGAPDDERVDEIILERVSVARDFVSLGMRVVARSGRATSFVAPVRLIPKSTA